MGSICWLKSDKSVRLDDTTAASARCTHVNISLIINSFCGFETRALPSGTRIAMICGRGLEELSGTHWSIGEDILSYSRHSIEGAEMIEAKVETVMTDPETYQQVVWLRSVYGNMLLPIAIGATEAVSIHADLTGKHPPRPLTHDLVAEMLDHFKATVLEVGIVSLKNETYHAEIVLMSRDGELRLDARPSDGIALSLKYGAPIRVSEEVLSQAGISPEEAWGDGEEIPEAAQEDLEPPPSEEAVQNAIDELLVEAGMDDPIPPGGRDPAEHLKILRKKMERAVKLEEYEEAGHIREEIHRIEGR